jgi:SAM-dependent methyltransferase
MASSDTAQISTIVDLIQIINPGSSLDIGCGYGKYGFLTKEYLMGHIWDKNKTIVNAVEGYESYISEMQRTIYNNVFICDAMDFSKYLTRDYDLVTIIDAFEHLSVEDGKKFITEILKHSKYLLISVPRYVSIQKGLEDDPNKLEEHRAFWTRSMFKQAGKCIIIPNNARKTIALFSKDGTFTAEMKKFCTKKLAMKFLPYYLADVANYLKWFFNRNNPDKFIKKSKL